MLSFFFSFMCPHCKHLHTFPILADDEDDASNKFVEFYGSFAREVGISECPPQIVVISNSPKVPKFLEEALG